MGIALKHGDERRELRSQLNIDAALFFESVGVPVTIKNISSHGALLACRHLPAIGSRVSVITDRHELWATVIWVGEDRCGVLFSQVIDPSALGVVDRLPEVTSATIHKFIAR
ncbi:PilZ domain-containing protein [Sphingobium sp. ZW T5_29]|uniref:PilZ domain-containing protein n=1 Tax=Sphingobium sp. ZW T5_29 TaxID=3378077 RepID=UPI0038534030